MDLRNLYQETREVEESMGVVILMVTRIEVGVDNSSNMGMEEEVRGREDILRLR